MVGIKTACRRLTCGFIIVLVLIAADYAPKCHVANDRIKSLNSENHYSLSATFWIPFYFHFELRDALTKFEESYFGAFGVYALNYKSVTTYNRRPDWRPSEVGLDQE
jgi:hypothetical protein